MVLGWILYCVAVSALLTAAAVLLEIAARRAGQPVRWVWAGSMAAALLIPLSALIRPPTAPGSDAPLAGAPGVGVSVGEMYAIAGLVAAEPGTGASLLDPLLLGAWGGASLVLLLLGGWSLLRLRRARSGWQNAVIDGVEVHLSRGTGPAVVGWFRPGIVLPRWVLDHTPTERSLILRHEREHLRARDPLLMVAAVIAASLLPWNLPLWWQLRRLRLAIELDCDARVIQRGGDLRGYASLLLEVGRRRAGVGRPLLAMAEPASFLERRIRTMTAPRRGRGWSMALASAGAEAALVAGACAVEEPPQGAASGDRPPVTGPSTSESPREPVFIPRDVEPSLTNLSEFTQRLERLYPALLKDAGIGGRVLVWAWIEDDGTVGDTRVHETSGYPSLDEAAMQALREARFTPAQLEGEPVGVWLALPVTFETSTENPAVEPDSRLRDAAPPPADTIPVANDDTGETGGDTPAGAAVNLADEPRFSPREIDPRLQDSGEFSRLLAREYPAELRDAGVGGRVLVWAFIDEEGRVAQTRIYESSGHAALDSAAMRALRQGHFSPATNRGEVVPVWVALPVTFQAPNNEP